jgi:hypothetical protein
VNNCRAQCALRSFITSLRSGHGGPWGGLPASRDAYKQPTRKTVAASHPSPKSKQQPAGHGASITSRGRKTNKQQFTFSCLNMLYHMYSNARTRSMSIFVRYYSFGLHHGVVTRSGARSSSSQRRPGLGERKKERKKEREE